MTPISEELLAQCVEQAWEKFSCEAVSKNHMNCVETAMHEAARLAYSEAVKGERARCDKLGKAIDSATKGRAIEAPNGITGEGIMAHHTVVDGNYVIVVAFGSGYEIRLKSNDAMIEMTCCRQYAERLADHLNTAYDYGLYVSGATPGLPERGTRSEENDGKDI